MVELKLERGGFECPYCKITLAILKWGTTYNDIVLGYSEVRCPKCEKPFEINVTYDVHSSK